MFKRISFIIEEEEDLKLLPLVENIVQKLDSNLFIYSIKKSLLPKTARYISDNIEDTIEYSLRTDNPDLFILHRKKVDPFKMLFIKPEYIKLSQKYGNLMFLFLREDCIEVKKVGIIIDFEKDEDFSTYIKNSHKFITSLGIKPVFLYSFHQDYYEMALSKTHTTEEAKEIIRQMLNENIDYIKEVMAKALGGKEAELKVLRGEPRREIPYFLHENKFDLAIISTKIKNKDAYLENLEISIGIF